MCRAASAHTHGSNSTPYAICQVHTPNVAPPVGASKELIMLQGTSPFAEICNGQATA